MGTWYGDAWEGIKSGMGWLGGPLSAMLSGDTLNKFMENINGVWNDYTGVTSAKLSAEQAEKNTAAQLAWEHERALNAHQWEIADLEKAGLNKVLTAHGQGANTAPISPPMADFSSIGRRSILDLINSALQMQRTSNEIMQIQAQADNLKSDSNLKGLQAITESYRKGLISAQTAKLLSENEIYKLKYASDKRWLDWERGSNVFKNISMPILTAIGTLGSLGKLKNLGKIMDKMSKNGDKGNIYNYYNNFSKLDL